jgi:hypothetical protein
MIGLLILILLVTRPRGRWGWTLAILLFGTLMDAEGRILPDLHYRYPEFDKALSKRTAISSAVIQMTGWDYDTLRERAYFVGKDPEDDLSVIYEQAYRKEAPRGRATEFDGLLAVQSTFATFLDQAEPTRSPDWSAVRDKIPAEMYESALSGDLSCLKTQWVRDFQLCFYAFAEGRSRTWNNLGYPYRFAEPEPFKIRDHQGVRSIGPGREIFYVNACDNLEPACTIYFEVSISDRNILELKAYGDPLGVPDDAPNPAWTASIRDAVLEVTCEGKTEQLRVASYVGYPSRNNPRYPGAFFLAPFRNRYPIACARPSRVSLIATQGESAFNNYTHKPLDPFRIEWVDPGQLRQQNT